MICNVASAFANSDDGDLGKVIGRDDRTRVTKTTITPYAQTVRFMVEHADGRVWFGGTGVMISPDTVLTAAHVLYENDVKVPVRSVTVTPGIDGNYEPFGSATSNTFYSFDEYLKNQSPSYDLAAIKLNTPLPSASYLVPTTNNSVGDHIRMMGYPQEDSAHQYEMAGNIATRENGLITYQIDSSGGQSGSPVVNDRNQLVAIHKGQASENYNRARVIDQDAMRLIDSAKSSASSGNGVTGLVATYRLYYPDEQRHLFTKNLAERNDLLATKKWIDEGVAWRTDVSGIPVFRLYNEALKRHIYTTDENEVRVLVAQGWKNEGTAWWVIRK